MPASLSSDSDLEEVKDTAGFRAFFQQVYTEIKKAMPTLPERGIIDRTLGYISSKTSKQLKAAIALAVSVSTAAIPSRVKMMGTHANSLRNALGSDISRGVSRVVSDSTTRAKMAAVDAGYRAIDFGTSVSSSPAATRAKMAVLALLFLFLCILRHKHQK